MSKFFAVFIGLYLIIAPVAVAHAKTTGGSAGDQFRADPNSKKKAGFIGQISSIAIAGVGTTVMLGCPASGLLPSMMIFNAGSLVYIASELLGGKAQHAFHGKKVADMEMLEEKMKGKSGGDVQKEALETALKDEQETLSIIKKRRGWLKAIKVVYSLATIAAAIEVIKSFNPLLVPPLQIAGCNSGVMITSSLPIKLAVIAAWTFVNMKNGEGMIGKYGGTAAALGIAFTGFGATMGGLLNAPVTRLVAFALATKFIMDSEGHLRDQQEMAEKNIATLERVIEEFNRNSQVTNSLVAGASSSGERGGLSDSSASGKIGAGNLQNVSISNSAVNPLASINPDMSKNCFAQGPDGVRYSTDCKQPVRLAQPTFDVDLNLPTLSSGANTAVQFANAVSSGDAAGANIAAASLESMASRVDQLRDNVLAQMNVALKEQNKDQVDLSKARDELLASSLASMRSEAQGQGVDLDALIDQGLGAPVKDSDSNRIELASAGQNVAIPSAQPMKSVFSEGSLSSETAQITAASTPTLSEALEDYESPVDDISKQSDVSLFQQLSNRYQASYERFFRRKDVSEATKP